MKTKEEVARTYDKDGYKLRAGCLCYKDESEKEVCLFVCLYVYMFVSIIDTMLFFVRFY